MEKMRRANSSLFDVGFIGFEIQCVLYLPERIYLIASRMKVQQKGTPRGQNKSLGRGKSFSSKVSTARLGKTQAVNSFLVDPVSFATHQPDDDLDSDEEPDVEPWLEEFEANEPSLRQERAIRSQINAMLGITTEEPGSRDKSLQIDKLDASLINKKMKKYQPANGSFSLFYGEKKGFEKMPDNLSSRGSSRQTKMPHLKLPALPVKLSLKQIASLQQTKKAKAFSYNKLSQNSKRKHLDILLQLREIERTGEVLTDFSSRLIDRIDRASTLADEKFGKLSQITAEMTADVGTYHLDEQLDGSYRKQLFSTPAKYLKK